VSFHTRVLRRRQAPLNPYVALADVAINLLLIMTVYLLVSTSIRDAYYASQASALEEKLRSTQWREVCRYAGRKGPNMEFRVKTSKLFAANTADVTKSGGDALASLAGFLKDQQVSERYTCIRVTVNQSMGIDERLAISRAVAVRRFLNRAGVTKQIIASGRTQERYDRDEADEVTVVLELKGPQVER